MKKKLYAITIGIIIFIALFSVRSIAETRDIPELREQRKKLQQQISENTLQIDELEGQISNLMLEVQDLNDRIYKYEVEVAVLDKEIADLNAKIADVQKQFNETEKVYKKRKNLLAKRIVAQYEQGEIVYLDFLLNSNGLMEFISNYYLIGEILNYDKDLLQECENQKAKINSIKRELDEYKEELKSKKDEQGKSAILLSNIRTIKNNQMSRLSEEEIALQQQIDEYQEQERQIEVELLMILTENLGSDYVGGVLAWPVPGYTTITSPYGMRIHPISGLYKLHTGVDIGGAPIGSYFVAANDGVVVTSRYSPSYGNLIVIDHGGGLSTLYAHGQERLVEVGDTVKRGEPVLTVGSTGYSTGPHAHFEVRVNGMWVNPLDYILKSNTVSSTSVTEEE